MYIYIHISEHPCLADTLRGTPTWTTAHVNINMYIYMYIYIYVCIYTYKCIYIIYIYIFIYNFLSVCVCFIAFLYSLISHNTLVKNNSHHALPCRGGM